MQVIYPTWEYIDDVLPQQQILEKLERAARTCYQSHDKITEGSAEKLIAYCIEKGHESVLEHVSISLHIVIDRAVSHELVRHRICSFSQESQRYVAYRDKDIDIVQPMWLSTAPGIERNLWEQSVQRAVDTYRELLARGVAAQNARSVLPNCTATRLVMTANIREWRHVLKLRTSVAAHPDMFAIMCSILADFQYRYPVLFGDVPSWKGKTIDTQRKA